MMTAQFYNVSLPCHSKTLLVFENVPRMIVPGKVKPGTTLAGKVEPGTIVPGKVKRGTIFQGNVLSGDNSPG